MRFTLGLKKRGTFYVNTNNYKDLNKNELLTLTLHENSTRSSFTA